MNRTATSVEIGANDNDGETVKTAVIIMIITTTMITHSDQIQMFFNFESYSVFAPLQIAISITLIFQQVCNATWVGLALMAAFVPLNTTIRKVILI